MQLKIKIEKKNNFWNKELIFICWFLFYKKISFVLQLDRVYPPFFFLILNFKTFNVI